MNTTLTFSDEARDAITEALKTAMNTSYQNASYAEKENLLKASYYWRTSQPTFDIVEEFLADCQKWGCD